MPTPKGSTLAFLSPEYLQETQPAKLNVDPMLLLMKWEEEMNDEYAEFIPFSDWVAMQQEE